MAKKLIFYDFRTDDTEITDFRLNTLTKTLNASYHRIKQTQQIIFDNQYLYAGKAQK